MSDTAGFTNGPKCAVVLISRCPPCSYHTRLWLEEVDSTRHCDGHHAYCRFLLFSWNQNLFAIFFLWKLVGFEIKLCYTSANKQNSFAPVNKLSKVMKAANWYLIP